MASIHPPADSPAASIGVLDSVDSLKAERDRYVCLAFCFADILIELDQQAAIVFVAGPTKTFFARSNLALLGQPLRDLVVPDDLPVLGQVIRQTLKIGRVQDASLRMLGPDGSRQWISLAACTLDEGGRLFLALRRGRPPEKPVGSGRAGDTGLHDRGSFADLAARRLKDMQAAGESAKITLVSIPEIAALQERLDDRDGKSLADSVGEILRAHSLAGDSAAQVGQGQFSILHAAGTRVDDVLRAVEEATRKADPSGVGAKAESTSMVMDAGSEVSEEDLAKGLLYALNKFSGTEGRKVRIQDMTANMSSLIGEAVSEVNAFKQVVTGAGFHVALQPIVHIGSGEIHHYEALCRFNAAPGESPFRTITFAEETGLIHEFDLAMARKVIAWLGKFPRNSNRYNVAVNVSGYSIGQPSYLNGLQQLLKDNAWTQGKLLFEITESSRMSDLEAARQFIQSLRSRGYKVCLDDFGAGAASFQYLSVLDVDVVKIDGSAVRNAVKATKGRAFLSALTELCRRMNVETIAEMVDSPAVLEFCRDCGCNYVQGYLFGKPSPELRDFSPLPHEQLFRTGSPVPRRRDGLTSS